ncbi:endochitinase A1-like [Bombus pyrosoma]|uniref:endochitinase A1-like n=1 Tax=Bombus pyrosoma TaxID=396416 RepID=UPI001CB9118F|nr:endochitinase A1-like [Bombus pyrosoma]
MKLLLRFVASIFLTSVRASSWPYHEIVGVGQSSGPLLVAPVYGVAPAVSLLPAEPAKKAQTIVAGPVTKTVVEGSSSGPVTIVSPGTPATSSPPPTTLKPAIASAVPEDTVLVKGASAGAVTLVAPSDNSVAIADTNNAASAEAETKKGAVAASAKAVVAIESAEESSTTKASTNVTATAIRETIGIASANAVIGPSTGPIIIAGPTVPPVPVPAGVEASTPEAVTAASVAASATAKSASVSSSAVANVSVSSNISAEQTSDVSGLASDATEPTRIEGSASSSSTVTSTSGSSTAFASARINLISPLGTIALGETPLSNVVVSTGTAPSAIVSGPSGSVSTGSASPLLLKVPLYHL